MVTDATVPVPSPPSPDPVKAELYSLRGEMVHVGGTLEWTLHQLSAAYAGSTTSSAGRQWTAVRKQLALRGLTTSLRTELSAVSLYFKSRNSAAHAAIFIIGVAQSVQMLRIRGASEGLITMDDLRAERDATRAGHQALQAIARALHRDDPAPLVRQVNPMVLMMILGG